MRVLVCGDRHYSGWRRMEDEFLKLPADPRLPYQGITIIHGAAAGADSMAAVLGRRRGFKIEAVPANWEKYGRSAGPIRNRWMLDREPDLVLAFHRNLENSKGTRNMVEIARKKFLPIKVIDD